MGEGPKQPFQLSFIGFLRISFQGCRVISDDNLGLRQQAGRRMLLGEGKAEIGNSGLNRDLLSVGPKGLINMRLKSGAFR